MALAKIVLLLIFYAAFLSAAQSVFIIIHGTWGSNSSWYMPGGDFFQSLEEIVSVRKTVVVPFCWSGGLGHESRVQAAHNLHNLIKSYDESVAIYLVAHSHGGNVAILTSQFLAQNENNKHRIRALYTLGTPVMSNYMPNMDVIMYLYNIFSFEDIIQPVLGISGREYFHHNRIANIRIIINGKEPDHGGLHDPLVARAIPLLHRDLKKYLQENNIRNDISQPCVIYCNNTEPVIYAFDSDRQRLLERDRQLSVLMANSFRNSLEMGSNIPFIKR